MGGDLLVLLVVGLGRLEEKSFPLDHPAVAFQVAEEYFLARAVQHSYLVMGKHFLMCRGVMVCGKGIHYLPS